MLFMCKRKKNALVIAGGQWQVPLIVFLKNRGYFVAVVDPYETSPGIKIADCPMILDVRDVHGIIKATENRTFDIVTTDQSDISVETVAILSKFFNTEGNQLEVVCKYSDKYISRLYASQINIPIPKFLKIDSISEVKEKALLLGLPVMLKPVDSQSSRGIFLVNENNLKSIEELAAVTFSHSREKYILLEELIMGEQLTVDGICSNYLHRTLAIAEMKHFRTGIASEISYPAVLPESIEKKLVMLNDRYVEKSGLKFGITHAEYFFNRKTEEIHLIEIACRGGGTLISSNIVKWVSGIDLYDYLLLNLEGKKINMSNFQILKRPAILRYFEFPNGVVENIAGVEEIRKMEGVDEFRLDFQIGSTLKPAVDGRSRHGFVIIFSENKSKARGVLESVEQKLCVKLKSLN